MQHDALQIRRAARAIHEFVADEAASAANRGALLLLGSAGTGKTHLLCDIAAHRLAAGLPTVVLLGQQFADSEPWRQIVDRLDLSCRGHDEFLGALDAAAQVRGCRALILIDALNEGAGKFLRHKHLAGVLRALQRYPRIAIALTCRAGYERIVIPDGLPPDRLVTATHRGFADHEYVATRTFFDHYGIERPNVPLLTPEFSNPLFLKLFCAGLQKRGMTRVPAGLAGITAPRALRHPQRQRGSAAPGPDEAGRD